MKLKGVMPALVTPFDENNNVDFKALEQHMLNLREAGVTGWVPNGSTGEYFSQSTEERRAVLQFVKDFANDDEILIAGSNAPATREVIEQTEIAREMAADSSGRIDNRAWAYFFKISRLSGLRPRNS